MAGTKTRFKDDALDCMEYLRTLGDNPTKKQLVEEYIKEIRASGNHREPFKEWQQFAEQSQQKKLMLDNLGKAFLKWLG